MLEALYKILNNYALLWTAPFERFATDILRELGDYRVTSDALMCFKEVSEAHPQELIDTSKTFPVHHKFVTLSVTGPPGALLFDVKPEIA